VLSGIAAVGAAAIVGAVVSAGAAAPRPSGAAAPAPAGATASAGPARNPSATPSAAKRTDARLPVHAAQPAAFLPPRSGRYTYQAPGGSTVTQVAVSAAGPSAWQLDETTFVRSALVQRRREAWTSSGVRVQAVWEAGQAQPCVWSDAPLDVAFPARVGATWSVSASCRVVNGSAGQSVTRIRGSFRTSGPVRITIGGHDAQAWLITGNEITTVEGTVHGHPYRTVDTTATRVWFLPAVGLPGRTELTGTVAITSEKGTTRHRIGQVTQLESLKPQ
jgi:hypothetical protein